MNRLALFLFLVIGPFGHHFAVADIMASINYFQYSRSDQIQGDETRQNLLVSYDYNLQLLLSSRYLIGLTYMKQTTSSEMRSSRESVFPNVGFFYGALLFEGGPVSRSVEKLNIDSSQEWRDPTGYYGAITIYESWARWVLVGFQFTFIDIEYRKYFDGVTESTARTRKVSVLNPSLRLSFIF